MAKSTFKLYSGSLNARTIVIATSLSLAISQFGYAATKAAKLKVTGGQTVSYFCDNGKKLAARYYNLSDNSLSFVKLTLNDKVYTLPQAVSASGVRYTDGHTVEWWSKADKAMLDEDVADDKSKLVECAEATANKAAVVEKAQKEARKSVVIPVKKAEVVAKPEKEAKETAAVSAGKAEAVEKAKSEAKQEAVERAKLEAKDAAAKQPKKPEAAIQTKKDASTTKEK
jgi:membrane-bound inhibitor of C-type lysozyme